MVNLVLLAVTGYSLEPPSTWIVSPVIHRTKPPWAMITASSNSLISIFPSKAEKRVPQEDRRSPGAEQISAPEPGQFAL
jgi:hypothetical protein